MTITPDTKDWTWVLERACPECGFEASAIAATAVAARVWETAATWPAALERADARERPNAQTWSPLEYAAHVRDVCRITLTRLNLMLEQVDPAFANWDQDETAEAERYNEQDPAEVARELVAAAEALAAALEAVRGEQWQRTGRRSDGAVFTIDSFSRYVLHDLVHHEWDVARAA